MFFFQKVFLKTEKIIINVFQGHGSWSPGVTVGGHFGPVQDICWEPQGGQFLLSVGIDQTTRLHGYWVAEDENEVGEPKQSSSD